ncbi:hypothetical protein ACFFX0_12305 [Citricoccus parietis]|uniref:Uncharacterized protein n=1 Tax=Citricoccus parietis TaxID=592307 RepID=A0ABV5FZ23_9MICC
MLPACPSGPRHAPRGPATVEDRPGFGRLWRNWRPTGQRGERAWRRPNR